MKIRKYSFHAKLWKYPGKSAWFFVTLPDALSQRIRLNHGQSEEGWGRLKTSALLGRSRWDTAIWYDTKHEGYLLPLKSDIRKKEKLGVDSLVKVQLELEMDHFSKARAQRPLGKP